MDIKQYISSGILEDYVLGATTVQEKQEVQCISHIYPEVQEELLKLEKVMEKFAHNQAVKPSPDLKNKILDSIENTEQINVSETSNAKVVQMQPVSKTTPPPQKKNKFPSLVAAASIVGLLFLSGSLFFNNNQLKDKLTTVSINEKQKVKTLAQLEKKIDGFSKDSETFQKIKAPDTQIYSLKGTDLYKEGLARVFWNKESNEVFFQTLNIPPLPSDKQYQLWAIVDGKPVDMGMLGLNNTATDIQKMKDIKNAGAFAITLEKRGGSPTPTLDAMYLIVETS